MDLRETERAIKLIKDYFQEELSKTLSLQRISAPIMAEAGTGVNDDLNGTESKVSFQVPDAGSRAEIVFSLAKWKRMALADYGFSTGEGLYTNMNAIRPDEVLDEFHSVYVDQWDWEKIILPDDRTLEKLKDTVRKIYATIKKTEKMVCEKYPDIKPFLPDEITFLHAADLQRMFPEIDPREREQKIAKKKGAVFIIGIGADLPDGKPHDGRAPDYDDWITFTGEGKRGLNGDIIVWYPPLGKAMELSSMGIRVDRGSLLEQLRIRKEEHRKEMKWHRMLMEGKMPLTIGGGIGQSRLCMLFLRKKHIGEVQASIWPQRIRDDCIKRGITLL